MNQSFLILELAHSLHGRVKRIHVSYRSVCYLLGTVFCIALVSFFFVSSYLRMTWKVARYNELRANFEHLRTRYDELQRVSKQRTDQLATLQSLASEVSVAYGFRQPQHVDANELATANPLSPTLEETIETYNFL